MRRPILLTAGTLAGLAGTLFANPGTRAELLSSPAPLGPGHLVALHPASTGPTTAATGPTTAAATTPAAAATTRTVDGQPMTIPYGVVQIRLIITGSTITDVQALQLPNGDGHSQGIAQLAVPMLRQQVLAAQSAQINGVSGATYTSGGYAQSVQSALDSIGGHP